MSTLCLLKAGSTTALLAVIAVAFSACASAPAPYTSFPLPAGSTPPELGHVAIVAGQVAPLVKLDSTSWRANSPIPAAAGRAGSFMWDCAMAPRGCEGPMCGLVYLVWLGACGVTSTAIGVGTAIAQQRRISVESSTPASLDWPGETLVQGLLRDEVEKCLQTSRPAGLIPLTASSLDSMTSTESNLASLGVETLVETSLLSVVLTDSRPTQLEMMAGVRAIRVADWQLVWSDTFSFIGAPRHKEELFANDAAFLVQEIELGYLAIAGQVCARLALA